MDNLPRLRAKELIILSTGTTQVAQKWPPKTFWTSKRPFSTSLYSAALWHVVGTARPPKMGWAPVPKQLGVPGSALHVGSEATAAPAGLLPEQVGEVRAGRPITPGPQSSQGSKPPQTLQQKLTSPRMGAKDLKPCEGNGNRQDCSPKRPKVAKQPLPRAGNKGLLCRALLVRLRPALGYQKLFPGVGAGGGHWVSGTRRGCLPGAQGAARSPRL